MEIKPFRGVRYNPEKVKLEKVVAPPYDVISPERQDDLYEHDPYNIVRLILGKEHAQDNKEDNRYARAAADFNKWQSEGILIKDEKPSIYLYEQTFEWHKKRLVRTGIITSVAVKEWGDGIFPHEKTMSKAKEDRYKLLEATRANFSPVFALYDSNNEQLTSLFSEIKKNQPEINIVDDRGVGDKLWVISDESLLKKITELLKEIDVFIADGHHRYETALRFHQNHPEIPDSKYVMMMLIDMSDKGLVILPAHRVTALGFKTAEGFLDDLEFNFKIEHLEPELSSALKKLEDHDHNFILYLKNSFYKLTFKDNKRLEETDFDVSILHKYVLGEILGIKPDKVEDQVFFTKSPEEAVKLAEAPQTAAFLIRPTPLSALKKVAKAHKTMPQKSTYFYPKLLSGLVINSLED